MAGNAGRGRRGNVHSRQGKPRRRVIEYRSGPGRGRMAGLASRRKSCLRVIRGRGALVVRQVTGNTGGYG